MSKRRSLWEILDCVVVVVTTTPPLERGVPTPDLGVQISLSESFMLGKERKKEKDNVVKLIEVLKVKSSEEVNLKEVDLAI